MRVMGHTIKGLPKREKKKILGTKQLRVQFQWHGRNHTIPASVIRRLLDYQAQNDWNSIFRWPLHLKMLATPYFMRLSTAGIPISNLADVTGISDVTIVSWIEKYPFEVR